MSLLDKVRDYRNGLSIRAELIKLKNSRKSSEVSKSILPLKHIRKKNSISPIKRWSNQFPTEQVFKSQTCQNASFPVDIREKHQFFEKYFCTQIELYLCNTMHCFKR